MGRFRRIQIRPLPPEQIIYKDVGKYHSWIGIGDCASCLFNRELPGSYGVAIDCGYSRPDELCEYSLRSVIIQLSLLEDFPCKYFIRSCSEDEFRNLIWNDGCMEKCEGCEADLHPCHLVNGWTHGESTCPGWEFVSNIFESKHEKRFLHLWLKFNRAYCALLRDMFPDAYRGFSRHS